MKTSNSVKGSQITISSLNPIVADVSTLHINAGRREKISRGDVVGFLCQKGWLTAQEIGKITVADAHVLVAVPAAKAAQVIDLNRPAASRTTAAASQSSSPDHPLNEKLI